MMWLSVILMVLMASGIILLSRSSPFEDKARTVFIEKITKLLDGTCEPIYEWENSFRVNFLFEGVRFVYEDIEMPGFKRKEHKAYLKHFSPLDFTLNFVEDIKSGSIKSDILTVSGVTEDTVDRTEKINVPEEFAGLTVFSNHINIANRLFENQKFVNVFSSFKNYNSRKLPFITLRIVDGVVILEFQSQVGYNPNLSALVNDFHSIEEYLDKMLIIVKIIRQVYLEEKQ